jgi:hypothetical protein
MGLAMPVALWRRSRALFTRSRSPLYGVLAAVALLMAAIWALLPSGLIQKANADPGTALLSDRPLEPIGVGRGIVPGRVVWAHDRHAVSWAGQGAWWADAYNDQAAIDRMVSRSIRALGDRQTDADAWQALFRYYNRTHGRADAGYRRGEKVAIKANLNNTTGHGTIDRLNTSPHLLLALVRQLTASAAVAPEAITIFDSSRFVPQNLYDKIHGEFPNVVFVDHIGGDGRIKAEFKDNAIPFSVAGRNASGIDTTAIQATYLIDAALLKGHVSSGFTLCAKNLFGALSIDPDWHKNAHDGFRHSKDGQPLYSAFTDFLGHKDLGEKTVLFMIDAFYANDLVDDPPHRKWKMQPFNNDWPASLLLSQDGVAIDSVGFDFLRSEWPDLADLAYSDNYLHEAALADKAPSKTIYDPERDGTPCRSLGVHEHWNNGVDKKYSRNLGKGSGIDLHLIEAPK